MSKEVEVLLKTYQKLLHTTVTPQIKWSLMLITRLASSLKKDGTLNALKANLIVKWPSSISKKLKNKVTLKLKMHLRKPFSKSVSTTSLVTELLRKTYHKLLEIMRVPLLMVILRV